jgi:hypothetical protein
MSGKKQLNYGLIDADVVHKIQAVTEKFTSDLMNDGYGKLNKKQFMADFQEVVLPTFTKWLASGMSAHESKREATREKVRQRMVEDINAKAKEMMVEIMQIVESKVNAVLEEYFGPAPPES